MEKSQGRLRLSDIKYLSSKIFLNNDEKKILNKILVNMVRNISTLIHFPNPNIFYAMVLRLLHFDYDIYYKKRKDPTRRISLLLITNLKKTLEVFNNISISTDYVINNSISKQQYFASREDIWCDINDNFNTHIYWKDQLYKRFGKEIPEYLDYKSIFPIAEGYHSFNLMARNYLGRYDDAQQPVIYITSNINIFSKSQLPFFDYIFINYSQIDNYIRNVPDNIKTIYYFDSLLDDRILYIKNKIDKILLTEGKLLSESQFNNENRGIFLINRDSLIKKCLINKLIIEYVPTTFDKSIEDAIEMLKKVKQNKKLEYEKSILSRLIINILSQPVTAIEYDQVACSSVYNDSNLDLLHELKDSSEIYESSEMVKCLCHIEDVFNKYRFDNFCPKKEKILQQVKNALKHDKRVLIVTMNKINNIALKTVISNNFLLDISELEEKGILVRTIKNMENIKETEKVDLLILSACNTLSQIKVMNYITYKKAVMFMYRSEIISLRKRLESIYECFCGEKVISLVSENYTSDHKNSVYKYLLNRLRKTHCNEENNKELDLENILNISKTSIRPKEKDYSGKNSIEAIIISFIDKTYTFVEKNGLVRVLSVTKSDIIFEKVDNLEPGDILVFINGEMRKDLYDEIIKNINKKDRLFLDNLLIKQWHERLEDVVIKNNLSYMYIFREMKKVGFKKKSPDTVKYWIQGYSMGPNNCNDIRILGKVLSITDFINNAEYYFEAMERVRVVRRLVARYLNNIIFRSRTNSKSSMKYLNEIEKLGLDLDEIQNAIQLKEISSIDTKYRKVKPSDIGVCYIDK